MIRNMKWAYSIKQKTKAAVILAVVLGLILLTNLWERQQFKQLEQSFASMYEDRLMAESYLFHLYENLREKEEVIRKSALKGVDDTVKSQLRNYNKKQGEIIDRYAQTYLTPDEKTHFQQLQNIFSNIDALEKDIYQLADEQLLNPELAETHLRHVENAFSTISQLSDIQTLEGEHLRTKSKQIFLGSISVSHFEMTIVIVLAVIIQVLIFSSKTITKVQKPENASWN